MAGTPTPSQAVMTPPPRPSPECWPSTRRSPKNNPLRNPLLTFEPFRQCIARSTPVLKNGLNAAFSDATGADRPKQRLFESTRAHQTRKIRTCFRLEKGSDFSFSSGSRMKEDKTCRILKQSRQSVCICYN